MQLRNVALVLTVLTSACAGPWLRRDPDNQAADEHTLPLRRVRLYASGVGYFERRGALIGKGDTLPVPTSHLDDALKSLVLLSPSGQLGSVTFASRLSPAVARARAGLPAEEDAALSYDRLLASLRGELVEVRVHGKDVRGRVVEVLALEPTHPTYVHKSTPVPEGQEEPQALQLLLLSDAGELMTFDARELESVRPLNEVVRSRLEAALAARLSLRSGRPQSLDLAARVASTGGEEIALAYLAEAPVWRPSYRLMLEDDNEGHSARLQAWALVHNDTDETWSGVTVELANGHPESFLFPLSAPRYDRRELHVPDRELSSVPQLSTTTPDAMWGDFSDYEGEEVGVLGGAESIGLGSAGGSGYGRGAGGFRSRDARVPNIRDSEAFSESSLIVLGDLSKMAGAEPAPRTAVSTFQVPSKLALPPHHSAMVPFIEGTIGTRSMVWFSAIDAEPERAIAIYNDTPNTLPPGPVAVFAGGGFQGEAELDILKPGERRFARIGRDPEVELSVLGHVEESEEKRLTFQGGKLEVHLVRSSETQIRLGSRGDRSREVYVALSVVKNAAVTGSDRLDYDRTTGEAFAVFDVEPGVARSLSLTTREGLRRQIEVSAISSEELEDLAEVATLPEKERSIVREALPGALRIEEVREQQEELGSEIEAVQEDVERLREHLATLTKSEAGSAQQQLVARILERDEQLRSLKAKNRAFEADLVRKRQALAQALRGLVPPEPAPK